MGKGFWSFVSFVWLCDFSLFFCQENGWVGVSFIDFAFPWVRCRWWFHLLDICFVESISTGVLRLASTEDFDFDDVTISGLRRYERRQPLPHVVDRLSSVTSPSLVLFRCLMLDSKTCLYFVSIVYRRTFFCFFFLVLVTTVCLFLVMFGVLYLLSTVFHRWDWCHCSYISICDYCRIYTFFM